MKAHEIAVGGRYTAKVSGRLVPLRVLQREESVATGRMSWVCVNEQTARRVTVKSARRFRAQADGATSEAPEDYPSVEQGGGDESASGAQAPAPDRLTAWLRREGERQDAIHRGDDVAGPAADRGTEFAPATSTNETTPTTPERTTTTMATKKTTRTAKKSPARKPAPAKAPRAATTAPAARDPRLPKPGTILKRLWHEKTYEVTVGESEFAFKGKAYRSLSALAKEITGAKSINGVAWFGLTERPAPKAKDAKKAKASDAPASTEPSTTATGETK